jgi:hypothetical protein
MPFDVSILEDARQWTSRAYLETLTHLQVCLIVEILDQPLDVQTTVFGLFDELEDNGHKAILHERRDFSRVGTGHFDDGISLADGEYLPDLPQIILCLAVDCIPTTAQRQWTESTGPRTKPDKPDEQKVGFRRLMAEKRSPNKIVVECRYCLARLDIAKLHIGRFVSRVEKEGLAHVELNDDYIRPYTKKHRGQSHLPLAQNRRSHAVCGSNSQARSPSRDCS